VDHLSETAQVTDAGRLTCAGAAGEPRLASLRRASVGLSAYGSGINVGKDSRRAAWPAPSPVASVCRSMSGQLGDDRSERIRGVGADDKGGEADLLTSSQDFPDGRRRVTWKYQ